MFGKNQIVSQHLDESGALKIVDTFYTIQGEGPYNGMPAVFVRLAGCNLRCTWCDTDFESNAVTLPLEELVQRVLTLANKQTELVVITGGEPLLQNVVPFVKAMTSRFFRVQIETAGTVWVPDLEKCDVTIVCSPKTGKVHPMVYKKCRHFKYVVGTGDAISKYAGIAFALTTATQPKTKPKELASPSPSAVIWIQPRDDHDAEKNAENLKFATKACLDGGYRMGVQLHKLLGVE